MSDPVIGDGERETVTNLAAGPPEPPAERLRLGRLVAIALVFVALGLASYLIVTRMRRGYEYHKEVRAILVPLTSGRPAEVEAVYQAASSRFKQTLILDAFLGLGDRVHRTLGKFVAIVEVSAVERMATVAGRATRVDLELEFEHGRTRGELSFLRNEPGKRPEDLLLGLSIDIPDDRLAIATDLERDRRRAPDAVVGAVEQIVEHLQAGRVAEVLRAAAPGFRETMTEDAVRALIRGGEQDLGALVGVVKVLPSSAQNETGDRARIQALLQYRTQRTTATFELALLDGTWRLLALEVDIPERFSPVSGPPPEEDDRVDDGVAE